MLADDLFKELRVIGFQFLLFKFICKLVLWKQKQVVLLLLLLFIKLKHLPPADMYRARGVVL